MTEAHLRGLRRLAEAPAEELALVGILPSVGGVPADEVLALTELLTPYGLLSPRRESVAELTGWLGERSGIGQLERLIEARIRPMAMLERMERVYDELLRITSLPECPPAARAIVEAAVTGPDGHLVQELRAYRLLRRDLPGSPLAADLELLLLAGGPAERLRALAESSGQPADPPRCLAEAARYQAIAATSRRGAEAAAARTLSTTFVLLSQGAHHG